MLNVTVVPTRKVEKTIHVTLFDVDIEMLRNIRDKVGVVPAIKVLRLMVKDCGLVDAKNYIESL